MKLKGLAILALVFIALGAFHVDASASACRNPGSVLMFPYYNTQGAGLSVMTITNTGNEDVWIRLVWIAENDCIPRDLWFELTKKDQLTFLDQALFFGNTRGFLYVYAVEDEYSVAEIDFDCLIGQEMVLFDNPNNPENPITAWGVNAVAFEALDVNGDGNLHLDGVEFSLAPKTLYFPRFLGQPEIGAGQNYFESLLILINLTGGTYFEATANALVYNDNEKAFSDFVKFPCWHIMPLNAFSLATRNDFLLSTDHDEDEPIGLTQFGVETGWFSLTGQEATNIFFTHTIQNPSIYGVLVETLGLETWAAADLPWQTEDAAYNNGMLWSTKVDGGDN
jgi:hypothetical protein